MKLAVPAVNGAGVDAGIGDRFADSKFMVLVEIEEDRISKDVEILAVPAGEDTGKLVFTLLGKGVNAVLLRAPAERERMMIAGVGVKVYAGAVGTVWDAIRSYIDGRLQDKSDLNPCSCESGRGCDG